MSPMLAVLIELQGKGVATKWFGKDRRFGLFFFSLNYSFYSLLGSEGKHGQMDKVQIWEFLDLSPVCKWAPTRAVMFVKSLNHFVL